MSESYQHNRHSVTGGGYHFQFTPKYRQPVFENVKIRSCVKNAFDESSKRLGVNLNCIEFGPDHVHLFITEAKNHSKSKLAGYLKGTTSRVVRKDVWDEVKKYEWGDAFWSGGYFCEAVGHVTDENIRHYITRQQKKHWARPVMKTQKHTRITQCSLSDFN